MHFSPHIKYQKGGMREKTRNENEILKTPKDRRARLSKQCRQGNATEVYCLMAVNP